MNSTLDELRSLIRTTFDIDPADLDSGKSILEYGIDSLALTELLFAAEDRFGVDLSDRDDSVTTLAGLAAFIDRKRAAVPASTVQASPS
ncbi:MAG TPA: acyl carrier protein [Burkholderiaceae bacterium]|nr:acyl carrier protein [Burkholderiaceae bacterium]